MSPAQEDTNKRIIIDKRPEQLKMDFFLWSRAAVGQLIEQEYGIKLKVRSIGRYLARWGSHPSAPSSAPTNKNLKLCRLGYKASTPVSSNEPSAKGLKSTGAMRPP